MGKVIKTHMYIIDLPIFICLWGGCFVLTLLKIYIDELLFMLLHTLMLLFATMGTLRCLERQFENVLYKTL